MTTLTIQIDDETLATLEREAQVHNTPVDKWLLKRAGLAPDRPVPIPRDSSAARAYGMIKPSTDKSDDDVLYEALAEKYGIDE